MRLFRRKPIIAFDLDAVKSIARRWRIFFNDAPYVKMSMEELDYAESMLVVDLAYRLLSTGKYRVVFFKNSVSKEAVRQDARECIITATKYSWPNKIGETVTPSYFPPTTLEYFMESVKFKNKQPAGAKLTIDNPTRFYMNDEPSVEAVEGYLNEGYM